jgi:hypothetical protein
MLNSNSKSDKCKQIYTTERQLSEHTFKKYKFLLKIKKKFLQINDQFNAILNSENYMDGRSKDIDFISKITQVCGYSNKTFFVSVGIMDEFYKKKININSEFRKDYLFACGLIACKFYEPRYSHFIHHLINFIPNNLEFKYLFYFINRNVVSREFEILTYIKWNVIHETSYDIIKSIFNQLKLYHSNKIKELDLTKILKQTEKLSIYLAILCLKCEDFLKHENINIAILCIIISVNKKLKKSLDENQNKFLNSFLYSLMKKFTIEKESINEFFMILSVNYKYVKSTE